MKNMFIFTTVNTVQLILTSQWVFLMVALLIIIIHNDYYNACSAHKSLHQSQYHGPMNWKQMNNKLVYEVEIKNYDWCSLPEPLWYQNLFTGAMLHQK